MFLNAPVKEKVYFKIDPGYEKVDPAKGVPLGMKLRKSPNGFRQSPLNWWNTVEEFLGEIGFAPVFSDPCGSTLVDNGDKVNSGRDAVNIVIGKQKFTAILTLCVNDVLLLGDNRKVLESLKEKFIRRFKMTDIGDVSLVLGMNVTWNRQKGTPSINQRNSTKSVLQRFGIANSNPLSISDLGPKPPFNQSEDKPLNPLAKLGCQDIAGSLMYLAQVTRYDIQFAVNQQARVISKPSKASMAAAKHPLPLPSGDR